jgi:hypothetical protein
MTKRFSLNIDELNRPWREQLGGVRISVQPSPFDVPNTIHFSTAAKHWLQPRQYHIQFEYVGNEPLMTRPLKHGLRVTIGKASRRLYGLTINLDAIPPQSKRSPNEFLRWLTDAIRSYSEKYPDAHRTRNYVLAEEALQQAGEELFELVSS